MLSLPLIDYLEAQTRRDAALTQVAATSDGWSDLAFLCLQKVLPQLQDTFIPEDWKRLIVPMIGRPHSENCWGAIAMKAIRRGIIEKTGQWGHSTNPASNKTAAPYYRRCTSPAKN